MAGAKDFTDAKTVKYTEAVEVMSGIGVINGFTDNSFKPADAVTRAQMAKMVAFIMNSGDDVGTLYAAANTFTDCNSHWAKGYIAFASKSGVVAGTGNGKFNPEGKVTGVQAAKMLLVALGYDSAVEGYTGADWAVNVLKDAKTAGLTKSFPKSMDFNKDLTREESAQMMFNALKADMVEYANKGTTIIVNGMEITTGASPAASIKDANEGSANYAGSAAGSTGLGVTQMCEYFFEDLKMDPAAFDANGLTGYNWKLKSTNKAISANYISATSLASTNKGTAVAKLLDSSKSEYLGYAMDIENGGAKVYVNGAVQNTDTKFATLQALNTFMGTTYDKAGINIELFSTRDNGMYDAVCVTTKTVYTLTGATATKTVGSDVQVIVPGILNLGAYNSNNTTKTVIGYEDLKKDDVVLVWEGRDSIIRIEKAEKVSGVATGKDNNDAITVNGTKYAVSGLSGSKHTTAFNDFTNSYDFYLDNSGAIVKATKTTDKSNVDVAFVAKTGFVGGGSMASSNYAEVLLVFADGTSKIAKLTTVNGLSVVETGAGASEIVYNDPSFVGEFVNYSTDSKGSYELNTTISERDSAKLANIGAITSGQSVYAKDRKGNADTIFVIATKSGADTKYTTYKGIANVPSVSGGTILMAALKNESNKMDVFVYVDATEATTVSGTAGEYVYFTGDKLSFEFKPKTDTSDAYYAVKGILNGVATEEIKVATTAKDSLQTNKLYKVATKNADGAISSVGTALTPVIGVSYSGGVMIAGTQPYNITTKSEVFFIDVDGNVTANASITDDNTDEVYVVKTSTDGNDAELVYIKQVVNTAAVAANTLTVKATNGDTAEDTLTFIGTTPKFTCAVAADKTDTSKTFKINSISVPAGYTYTVSGDQEFSIATAGTKTVTFNVMNEDLSESATFTLTVTIA